MESTFEEDLDVLNTNLSSHIALTKVILNKFNKILLLIIIKDCTLKNVKTKKFLSNSGNNIYIRIYRIK